MIQSFLMGVGLAMDAFSVSLADGLNQPRMKARHMIFIAGIFGVFQFLMPLIGWFCVHSIAKIFTAVQPFIPWIALILLVWIGVDMIRGAGKPEKPEMTLKGLMVQGIATSIDALSVGFAIASYLFGQAFSSCLIIGVTTWVICIAGLELGKKFGFRFEKASAYLGGVILICIGLEIVISSFM